MSRRRRIKERKSRKKLAYGVIIVAFILACFLAYSFLHSSDKATSPEVVIVDHLSFFSEQRNQTFVDACKNILEKGGLTWAYYGGEQVTVDFYRKLPSYGTSLIILRVHSAIMGEAPPLGLFTSERYSDEAAKKYPEDVIDGRLVEAFFSEEERAEGISYFGIVPKFVEESMKGEFENAIVIMMGCDGLGYIDGRTGMRVEYTGMAEAFINKGAKVYISWNGPVGVNYTDQATVCLLQHLILEKQNIGKAVEETMEEVDQDPDYKSILNFYPDGAANYVVPNLKGSLTMNVAYTSPTSKAPKKSKHKVHE